MTEIQTWLDEARALADQATEGPWGGTWNRGREGNICGETDVLDATNVNVQDLLFITDARTRLPQALNAIQAVLDLHKPEKPKKWVPVRCNHCRTLYPCLDVRTIQAAIKEQPC